MSATALHRGLLLLLSIGLAAGSVAAGKTVFNPAIELDQGYNDNIGYTGDDELIDSDRVTRLGLDLPYRRQWRTGFLDLRFRPVAYRYMDSKGLDHDEYFLRFAVSKERPEGAKFGFTTIWRKTQQQGVADQTDDPDLFFGRRNDRDLLNANLSYENDLGRRWLWQLTLGASSYKFTPIEGDEQSDDPRLGAQDRNEYRGAVRFAKRLSRNSNLGLRFSVTQFELDISGEETSGAILVVYQRRTGRNMSFEAALGGFHNQGTKINEPSSPDQDYELSGVQGSFRLDKSYEKMRLAINFRHQPSAGGALLGTSTNTVLSFTMLSLDKKLRHWRWQVSPRLAHRDPTLSQLQETEQGTITTAGLYGMLEYRVIPEVGLKLTSNYTYQDNADTAQNDIPVFVVGLGMVWNPWEQTRMAQR